MVRCPARDKPTNYGLFTHICDFRRGVWIIMQSYTSSVYICTHDQKSNTYHMSLDENLISQTGRYYWLSKYINPNKNYRHPYVHFPGYLIFLTGLGACRHLQTEAFHTCVGSIYIHLFIVVRPSVVLQKIINPIIPSVIFQFDNQYLWWHGSGKE